MSLEADPIVPTDDRGASVEQERDLYLQILSLSPHGPVEKFLDQALSLALSVTGARVGFLELRDPEGEEEAWSLAVGCSGEDEKEIGRSISRGIIAEALLLGETVETDSARLDHRFHDRPSVRRARIDAVVAAPIGGDAGLGIVYLQGASEGGPFTERHRGIVELFARHLAPVVEHFLARRRLAERSDPLADLRRRYALDGIIGRSHSLARAVEQAMMAAPLDVNVMLRGESGTGKSQLAAAIHENSGRSSRPFVELNCAALPEALIESELFGAMAGSHSEARVDRDGKISAAEGGTLFLDEIAELPHSAQSKLLQVLQSREYYPLGATAPRRADVRFVAATNADLEAAMADKRFRSDLYFRLQVLPIELPALAHRRSDLAELSRALLAAIVKKHGLVHLELTRSALAAIEVAEWPGNIRQLQNVLEAGAIRAVGQRRDRVAVDDVFPQAPSEEPRDRRVSFQEATRRFQSRVLHDALIESDWNAKHVASELDLSLSHVYNLIKAFGLEREASD